MPCNTVIVGGLSATICTRGRRRIKACCVCGAPAPYGCDWKVPDGTCDKPLCERHTLQPAVGKDLCPEHAAAWEQRSAERKSKAEAR